MKHLTPEKGAFDVTAVREEIAAWDQLWDDFDVRTTHDDCPFTGTHDIWLRGPDLERFAEIGGGEHESIWLPASESLVHTRQFVEQVASYHDAERLGAVLITKIPSGAYVYPHTDQGWHAEYYKKLYLSVESNVYQAFHMLDGAHVTLPGESFWFVNQQEHWVTNASQEDRVSLIICMNPKER